MNDLFTIASQDVKPEKKKQNTYNAEDIEVLEGLEPVRRRPGMYIGGTDERALHHLVAEVLDNSMDEAVAGHASFIKLKMNEDGSITVEDNGRGIPVDKHPKYPDKSALEVILTTLHSGGKFSNKAYNTAGGLHGVGISVVNALSSKLLVQIYRDKKLYSQEYSKGSPITEITNVSAQANKKGTIITFYPDEEIFGANPKFSAKKLYEMAKSKAYLYKGVEIFWEAPC
jgi:topoisomerase-4 subunit B